MAHSYGSTNQIFMFIYSNKYLIIYSRENINMRNQKHSVSFLRKLSVYEK